MVTYMGLYVNYGLICVLSIVIYVVTNIS